MYPMQDNLTRETSDAPESGIVGRVPMADETRDTLVEAPSRWMRFRAFVGAFVDALLEVVREPRLSDRLPPLPQAGKNEPGELLLLDILRAPPAYQHAAITVAHYAVELRRLGDRGYAEGLVHFALSRMRPDKDGLISFVRLRDILSGVSVSGVMVPALRRLEEHGIVSLISTPNEQRSALGFNAIELHVPL